MKNLKVEANSKETSFKKSEKGIILFKDQTMQLQRKIFYLKLT